MALTEEQRADIANALADAAGCINAYIRTHSETISDKDRRALREYFRVLQRASTIAVTEAVEQSIAGMQDAAAKLIGVTNNAKDLIDAAKSIRRNLTLIAALADLGAGIVAADPGAVLKAVTNLDKIIAEVRATHNRRGLPA